MNRYFIIASILMIFIGLVRGIGGFLLILHGNSVDAGPRITASECQTLLLGIGLIIVFILFLTSAFLLIIQKSKIGWILSWIAIAIFLLGGIINGFVLFGKPNIQGQIINVLASVLIGINLILGKVSKK